MSNSANDRRIDYIEFPATDIAATKLFYHDVFGFREVAREGALIRFSAAGDVNGSVVDIYEAKGFLPGRLGTGSVHHVAFRATDDADQAAMAKKLISRLNKNPVASSGVHLTRRSRTVGRAAGVPAWAMASEATKIASSATPVRPESRIVPLERALIARTLARAGAPPAIA